MANQSMRPGEIYLARFPFCDVPGMKLRPVPILTEPLGTIPEILAAYISSVVPAELLPWDVPLDQALAAFRSTNLKVASTLRLHKLATIHCSSLARYLGVLNREAFSTVLSKLRDPLHLQA